MRYKKVSLLNVGDCVRLYGESHRVLDTAPTNHGVTGLVTLTLDGPDGEWQYVLSGYAGVCVVKPGDLDIKPPHVEESC